MSMRSTRGSAAVVAVVVAVLAGVAGAVGAAPQVEEYVFRSGAGKRNLDAVGNDPVTARKPVAGGAQGWYLPRGPLPGHQLESVRFPGRCATATSVDEQVYLNDCNSSARAQYWDYVVRREGSRFQSMEYTDGCITDKGEAREVLLNMCGGAAGQVWLPKRQAR
jgi:hypothetical protein